VTDDATPSARRAELLELAYGYAVSRGRADLSLRPLASAIGSSPRVLLYLFGSKEGLIRALLARARADELALLGRVGGEGPDGAASDGASPDGAASDRASPDGASSDGASSDREGSDGEGADPVESGGLAAVGGRIWDWLADESRRGLLSLWVDGYARSLAEPAGPWAGFAADTVADWLAVLAAAQPGGYRDTPAALAERSLVLAVLRGALLDLLATGDAERTTAAVRQCLTVL
jgi:AcrR family transcriptional regulator